MVERSVYARMGIVVLALAGFFDSAYLMLSRFQTDVSMICPVSGDGCTTVRDSPWSTIPPGSGVPVALLGLVGYALVFGVAMAALHTDYARTLPLPLTLLAIGSAGVLFSIYLVGIQYFIIQAFCSWCLLSALLMATIWLLSLYDWRVWRSEAASTSRQPLSQAVHRTHS